MADAWTRLITGPALELRFLQSKQECHGASLPRPLFKEADKTFANRKKKETTFSRNTTDSKEGPESSQEFMHSKR